ncbi:Peptidase family M23 [compost metagenome]
MEKIFISIYSIAALSQMLLLINFICSILTPSNSLDKSLNLHFPLKGGIYVILHGGNNVDLNYHYSSPRQKYAIDIAKINGWGWRKTPFNKMDSLESYNIYGDTLYSPIAGEVVKVVDSYSDLGANPYKNMNEIEKSNMIVIRNNEYYVFLLHLKQESALVKEGQHVDNMMPIAKVGNSGYSSEPHLHIHAMKKTTKDSPAISIPITFDGQSLKRNDLVWNTGLIFR